MEKHFLIVATIQETIEGFLIPHIKLLESMGYQVWLATNMDKEIPEELRGNRWVNIDFSRNPFSRNSLRAAGQLKKLLRENQFHGIHCHTPVAAFLTRFVAGRLGQKNIIYTAHGFHFYRGAPLKNWLEYYPLEWLAARWTDKLITINEEDYRNSLKLPLKERGKHYYIHGAGVNLARFRRENVVFTGFREKLGIGDRDFVLITIGEINDNKNQIQTLKALRELKGEGKNIKYIIVGQGPNRDRLEGYCRENGLEENVIFTGTLPPELIPEVIHMGDLVVSTSKREGLGLNLIEGIASGKPVIGTRNRGHREIIKEGINGYFVEIGDSRELASLIRDLLEKRKKIIEGEGIDEFSETLILQEMRKIYEEALEYV